MKYAGMREPPFDKARRAVPGRAIALATATKRLVPVPRDLDPERGEPFDVRGDGVLALMSHGQVTSTTKSGL